MRVAVIQFPGSNADYDALHALRTVGADAYYVFHKQGELKAPDALVIPGGFSYGDYLRPGAIAGFSPISAAIRAFAERGGPVLGICNGFQVLTELGLLPGALAANEGLNFECRDVAVAVEAAGAFSGPDMVGQVLRLPIAHADGRYVADPDTLAMLEREGRVALRYRAMPPELVGEVSAARYADALPTNPNGSVADIAGIYNADRNVLGMMPHPERATDPCLGRPDGRRFFDALAAHLAGTAQVADTAQVAGTAEGGAA